MSNQKADKCIHRRGYEEGPNWCTLDDHQCLLESGIDCKDYEEEE